MTKGISGTQIVRLLAEQGKRIFTTEEAMQLSPQAGISPSYVTQALHYLTRTGWVDRLRRGLYVLGPSATGTAPIHDFEIGIALVKPAAISHWSAMRFHNMTEQIPRRVFVTTTRTLSIPRIANNAKRDSHRDGRTGFMVRNTFYQFVKVKPDSFFGVESYWIGETKVPITDPERTLLDALAHPDYCGGWDEVFGAFQSYAAKLHAEKIVGYALRLNAAIAKRLGWMMETLKLQVPALQKIEKLPIKGYRLLDASGPADGPMNRKWMLRINIKGSAS